jgi:hypothetical protein
MASETQVFLLGMVTGAVALTTAVALVAYYREQFADYHYQRGIAEGVRRTKAAIRGEGEQS